MAYTYIERYYGIRYEPGMRVVFTEYKHRPAGTVRRVQGDPQYVSVKFDDGHIGNCHPTSLEIVPVVPTIPVQ